MVFQSKITSKSLSSFQIANLQNCWCIPLRVHDQFLFFLPWTFLQRVITRYQFLGSQDVNSATDPEHGRFLEVMGREIPLIYLLVGQGTLAGVGGQLVRRCPKSWGYPQSSFIFHGIFIYKPCSYGDLWGYPHLGKPPVVQWKIDSLTGPSSDTLVILQPEGYKFCKGLAEKKLEKAPLTSEMYLDIHLNPSSYENPIFKGTYLLPIHPSIDLTMQMLWSSMAIPFLETINGPCFAA